MPRTDFSFDDKVIKARSVGSLGKLADSEEAFVTTNYGQGDIGGEVRVKSFGHLLYAIMGTKTSSTPADDAVSHLFNVAQSNQHQSLCFTVVDSNTSEIYKLVMLDSLEINSELDEVVTFNSSFMSKKGTDTTMTVPAAESEFKFTKKHLRLKVAADISSLAAQGGLSLKSLSLNISKNVELDDVLGTAEPEDILNRQLSVEGSMTLLYHGQTDYGSDAEIWKNYMRDGNSKAMEIAFINTDQTIGSGSTNPTLTFQLPKVDFFDWEPDYSLDEVVSQTISFKASRDVANNQDIIHTATLVNGVTTY